MFVLVAAAKGQGRVKWVAKPFYFVHRADKKVNGHTVYEVRFGHSSYPEGSKVVRDNMTHLQAVDYSINRNNRLEKEGRL